MAEKINFTMPHLGGHKRAPSYFAASCMYLIAAVGLSLLPFFISGLEALCAALVPGFDPSLFDWLNVVLFYGGCIVLPLFLYMRARPGLSDAMRFNGVSTPRAVLCALAALLGVFFTNYLSYLWMMLIEAMGGTLTSSGISVPSSPSGLCVMIVFVAVLPGVCEELLFRGAVLSAWERSGSVRAILISSLLFAGLHSNVEGLPSEIFNGVVLAVIAVSTDSIFACMIYHTVFNSATLIISYITQFESKQVAEESVSLFAALGGLPGVIRILIDLLLVGTLMFWVLRTLDHLRLAEGRRTFGNEKGEPHDWTFTELGVLFAGLGVIAVQYLSSIMRMAGVIR